MLLKLNIMRNHANTANAIHLINEDDQDTLSADNLIKFPFDKIMIDMKLFNWNGSNTQFLESQFKRFEWLLKREIELNDDSFVGFSSKKHWKVHLNTSK